MQTKDQYIVLQGAGVTFIDEVLPYVKTLGIMTCIAIVTRDPINKISSLDHLDFYNVLGKEDVSKTIETITDNNKELDQKPKETKLNILAIESNDAVGALKYYSNDIKEAFTQNGYDNKIVETYYSKNHFEEIKQTAEMHEHNMISVGFSGSSSKLNIEFYNGINSASSDDEKVFDTVKQKDPKRYEIFNQRTSKPITADVNTKEIIIDQKAYEKYPASRYKQTTIKNNGFIERY